MPTEQEQLEQARVRAALLGETLPDSLPTDDELAHPLLTQADIDELRVQARNEVEAARRENARKRFLADEKVRLREEEGVTTGSRIKDEIVSIVLDLAEHSEYITLGGKRYYHGAICTVPRHIADSLREIMFRGWLHQNAVDGKDLASFYQKARVTKVSPVRGTINAPSAPDA